MTRITFKGFLIPILGCFFWHLPASKWSISIFVAFLLPSPLYLSHSCTHTPLIGTIATSEILIPHSRISSSPCFMPSLSLPFPFFPSRPSAAAFRRRCWWYRARIPIHKIFLSFIERSYRPCPHEPHFFFVLESGQPASIPKLCRTKNPVPHFRGSSGRAASIDPTIHSLPFAPHPRAILRPKAEFTLPGPPRRLFYRRNK
jgi:hypothetical protein